MKTIVPSFLQHLKEYHLEEKEALQELNDFNEYISEKRHTFIGYPCNGDFKLKTFFKWWEKSILSKSPLNDVGDPETTTLYSLNARPFEKKVIHFFAELFSVEPYWGYVTSGGTQGNEQGLYLGREILSRQGKPILYFSADAHYSIASLGKVLGLECRIIASKTTGEMDYENLKSQLDQDRPALFSLSIGTTFKGAIDRLEIIQQIVKNKGVKAVYYHADAALFGGYLPFYPDPHKIDLNFKKYPYDSIAVSGHKFFGSPFPMGIFLSRHQHVEMIKPEYIEYIHSPNITIPCSRSSLNTLVFWWIITTTPLASLVQDAVTILDNAHYLYEQLKIREHPAWLNPYSNTIYFRAPSEELCKRWILALFTCQKLGLLAHVVVMQHVDKNMINQFLHELDKERSLKQGKVS